MDDTRGGHAILWSTQWASTWTSAQGLELTSQETQKNCILLARNITTSPASNLPIEYQSNTAAALLAKPNLRPYCLYPFRQVPQVPLNLYLTRTPVPVPLLLTTHGLPKSMLHYFHPPCQMQLNSSIIKKNARNKGKGQSVIPEIPLFCAVLTLHLGSAPSHVLSALSGSTSATAVHDTLAIELEVLYMSGVASPSQSILSGSSTSATESTMVDDTFAAGHDMLQFLSTSSSAAGPSHPTFNFTSTSTAEFTMFDDTLVTGYEASQFSSPMLGPSQPIFDLGASTSAAAAELATELDDKMTAETQSPDISIHSIRWHDPVHKKWLKAKEKDKGIVETNAHKQVVVISIDSKSSQLLCFLLGQIANYRWSPSIPFLPGDRAIDVSDAPAMG